MCLLPTIPPFFHGILFVRWWLFGESPMFFRPTWMRLSATWYAVVVFRLYFILCFVFIIYFTLGFIFYLIILLPFFICVDRFFLFFTSFLIFVVTFSLWESRAKLTKWIFPRDFIRCNVISSDLDWSRNILHTSQRFHAVYPWTRITKFHSNSIHAYAILCDVNLLFIFIVHILFQFFRMVCVVVCDVRILPRISHMKIRKRTVLGKRRTNVCSHQNSSHSDCHSQADRYKIPQLKCAIRNMILKI